MLSLHVQDVHLAWGDHLRCSHYLGTTTSSSVTHDKNSIIKSDQEDSPGKHNSTVRFGVQVHYGSQQQRTRFAKRPAAVASRSQTNCSKDRLSRQSTVRWLDAVDIQDKEKQETIEIALLLAIQRKGGNGRKIFRHSITTTKMQAFRSKPEQRITLSLPLRSVSSLEDDVVGHLQLSATYTDDDCVNQGYLFALFCGLPQFFAFRPRLADLPSVPHALECFKDSTNLVTASPPSSAKKGYGSMSTKGEREEGSAEADASRALPQFLKPSLTTQSTLRLSPPDSPMGASVRDTFAVQPKISIKA